MSERMMRLPRGGLVTTTGDIGGRRSARFLDHLKPAPRAVLAGGLAIRVVSVSSYQTTDAPSKPWTLEPVANSVGFPEEMSHQQTRDERHGDTGQDE